MTPYRITITDNRTGETCLETSSECIIYAYKQEGLGEGSGHALSCGSASLAAVALTAIDAAHDTVALLTKKERRLFYKICRKIFFKRVFARFSRKREDQEG